MESQRYARSIAYVVGAYAVDLTDFLDDPAHPLHEPARVILEITRQMHRSEDAVDADLAAIARLSSQGVDGALSLRPSLMANLHVSYVRAVARREAFREALDIAMMPVQWGKVRP